MYRNTQPVPPPANLRPTIVKEGWLKKADKYGKHSKNRWCVLLHNTFCYYTQSDKKDANLKGAFELRAATVKIGWDIPNIKLPSSYVFQIQLPQRSYYFACQTEKELNDWKFTLEDTLGIANDNLSSSSSSIIHPPSNNNNSTSNNNTNYEPPSDIAPSEEEDSGGDLTDDDAYDEYGQPLDLAAIARAVNDAALNRNNTNASISAPVPTTTLVPPGPMPAINETEENNSALPSIHNSRSHSPITDNKNSFLNYALNVPGLGTLDPNTSINTSNINDNNNDNASVASTANILPSTTNDNNDENMTFYVISASGDNKPDKRYAMMVRKSKLHKLTMAKVKKNLSAAVNKDPSEMILHVQNKTSTTDTDVELQDTWSGADINMMEGSELRLSFRNDTASSTSSTAPTETVSEPAPTTAANLESLSSLLPPPPPPAPPSRKKGKSKLRQIALTASMFGSVRNLNAENSPATVTGLASVSSVNTLASPDNATSPSPAVSKIGSLFGKKAGGGGGMLAALKAAAAAQEAAKKQAEDMNENNPTEAPRPKETENTKTVNTNTDVTDVKPTSNGDDAIVNPIPPVNPQISQRLDKRMRIRQLFNQLASADELMFGTINSSPNNNPVSYQDDGGAVGRADLAATLSADIEISTWPEYENLITSLLATSPSDIITWNEFSVLFSDIADGQQTQSTIPKAVSPSVSSLPSGIAVPSTEAAASPNLVRSPSTPGPVSPGTSTGINAFSPNNKNSNLSPVPVPATAASVRARKAREVVVEVEDGPQGHILDLVVRTGENPNDIAYDFVQRHGMAQEDAPALVELVTPRLLQAYTIELADTRKALFDTLQALEIANNRLNAIENNPNIVAVAMNAANDTASKEAAAKIAATEQRALEAETALSAEKVLTNDLRSQIELAANTAATALKEQAETLSLLSATQASLDQVTKENKTKITQLTDELEACKQAHAAEIEGLKTTINDYETEKEQANQQIITLQQDIEKLKAEFAEKGKRKSAWERYVDGAEASGIGSSDAALNAITSGTPSSDRRSSTASAVANLQQGDWRTWAAEKREILARANADRAALIEENKRLRSALDSGGLDAEAKLRAQDEEKARIQAEITTVTAARNRAETELRSVYKAWEEDGRRWATERKSLFEQLESLYNGNGNNNPSGYSQGSEDFAL